MAQRTIVLFPHEALTTPASDVTEFDETLHTLIDDMAETMYAADGVGLAANQIAVLQRVTVIDVGEEGGNRLLELVNPRVVESSGSIKWHEGCLSFPQLYEDVRRANVVKVAYQDRHGEHQTIDAEGFLAVALQHEIDHLDGVLFVDRISSIKRRFALRRFEKLLADA